MRLIDADAIKYTTMYKESWLKGTGQEASAVWKETIDEMPTIDAVPVIRCKDCKFATITDGVNGREPEVKYCDIWFPTEAEYMPISYYCASAERKREK